MEKKFCITLYNMHVQNYFLFHISNSNICLWNCTFLDFKSDIKDKFQINEFFSTFMKPTDFVNLLRVGGCVLFCFFSLVLNICNFMCKGFNFVKLLQVRLHNLTLSNFLLLNVFKYNLRDKFYLWSALKYKIHFEVVARCHSLNINFFFIWDK